MGKAPCKNCEFRAVGCHSVCEKYIEYKRKNDEEREEAYEAKQIARVIDVYVLKGVEKTVKRKQNLKRRGRK